MHVGTRVAALAARQHGLVTFAQLVRVGLTRGKIKHWATTGRLHRVHVGVYAVGHAAISDKATLLAAVMACAGEAAALGHDHAVLHLGLLPPWKEMPLTPTHVTVPSGSGKGRRSEIVVHRAPLPRDEVTVENSIPVTCPARTILDLAARIEADELERLVDRAVAEDRLRVQDLRAMAGKTGRRGAPAVRRLLAAAARFDGLSDSELEDEFVRVVRAGGLAPPTRNVRIDAMKVDAVWKHERVAVELDGYHWHRTRYRQEKDRDREARLRRLGWFPVRYSARQVFDQPLLVIADLAAVLASRRT